MGYYIHTHSSVFRIRKDNLDKFFDLVNNLMSKENIDKYSDFGHFSWISTEGVLEAVKNRDLVGVFREWRWDCIESSHAPDLACVDITTINGSQKMGDDEVFFAAIAPVVEDGSFIEVRGEDDAAWCWSWRNGKFFVADALEMRYGTEREIPFDNPVYFR